MDLRGGGVVLLLVVAGCTGSATRAASPSSSGPPTVPATTTSTSTSRASPKSATTAASRVFPVVACPTTFGVQNNSPTFVPHQLPAAVDASGLTFYSNGRLTVLGPAGWVCSALVAADGGQRLDVYQPGQPDLSTGDVAPGTPVVQLDGEYTGHGPGAQLICPLFPSSPAASFLQGSPPCAPAPAGQQITRLTDDVVTFEDAVGVRGTGAGSGGNLVSRGAAVYPQMSPEPQGGVTVSVLSCTLPSDVTASCLPIESDFLVRDAPAYPGTG